jgi:mannose-6-phosphate isomerase-like protein (cupin superfamily)
MELLEGAGAFRARGMGGTDWVEHLRVPDLSVGTYSIRAGGADPQSPHAEDEIYVVLAGRGQLVADTGTVDVEPGSVVYVPAHEAHHFTAVTADLTLVVIFAPPEGTRA